VSLALERGQRVILGEDNGKKVILVFEGNRCSSGLLGEIEIPSDIDPEEYLAYQTLKCHLALRSVSLGPRAGWSSSKFDLV
jgi:hypothetical protein